jgi:ABC-type multidrug transport system fused ATPase/permease subunit
MRRPRSGAVAPRSLMQGRTTLVIVHRLWTVRDSHLIVELDNGRNRRDRNRRLPRPGGGLYARLQLTGELIDIVSHHAL